MKPPTKIAIVGAGGIGCVLAPLICRMASTVIIDADSYAPENVGRQFPALQSTANKAMVLAEMIQPQTLHRIHAIDAWVQDLMIANHPHWKGTDCIVAGVDNNASRRIIIGVADDLGLPCILAGNSHAHGEAHLFIPGVYNPLDHFEFEDDNDPVPWSCNSDKTLEEHPQTAAANQMAAAAALHLLLSYQTAIKPMNCLVYSRLDPFSSICKRAKDKIQEKDLLPVPQMTTTSS